MSEGILGILHMIERESVCEREQVQWFFCFGGRVGQTEYLSTKTWF